MTISWSTDFKFNTESTDLLAVVQHVLQYNFNLPLTIPFSLINWTIFWLAWCEFLKKVVRILTCHNKRSLKFSLAILQAIKLIEWATHQTFSIFGYFSCMIFCAFLTFAALSEITAEIRSTPISLITSSIIDARYLAVWEFSDKSQS